MEKAGLSNGFVGSPQPVAFLGQVTELEMDEWPAIDRRADTILESGMVLSVEAKYVFLGEGVVEIENAFVITKFSFARHRRLRWHPNLGTVLDGPRTSLMR